MRGTLRMPNAIVAASKLRSANGSASALASVKVTVSANPRAAARSRPTASMSALMSQTVARVPSPPAAITRNATSPVPPAMSSNAERPVPRRIDRGDQRILPGAMQAERHQVVHQVVAAGDAVEHVVDQRLLVRKRHFPRAELGGVCHCISCLFGQTIARRRKRRYVSRINHLRAADGD